jgi:hypothetical protein
MKTKQTAVEWLVEKMSQYNFEMEVVRDKYIPEAIQMEKEQIMNAFDSGYFNYEVLFHDNAEEYFKETY